MDEEASMTGMVIGFVLIGLAITAVLYLALVVVPESNAKYDEYENKLDEQAKTECINQHFYDNNFERCERLEVRPA